MEFIIVLGAGKHDRRHYTHHTIYPLYYIPLYYYTPFTVFPGMKTNRKFAQQAYFKFKTF